MKKKTRIVKRILSVALATALVATSVQITAVPSRVVLAAPGDITTGVPLGDNNVKDQNVLTFYKIVANAVFFAGNDTADNQEEAKNALTYIGSHTAQEVITAYGSDSNYTQNVSGTYLSAYTGKIDFGTLKVTSIEGIGWAQSASEIDMSQISLTTGASITSVPAGEFRKCAGLVKITLPSTVTTIEANAFDGCSSLTTLGVGTAQENVVALDSITTVGSNAFSECTSIKNIDFGQFDTRATKLELKGKAFLGCTSLEKIEIPIKDAAKIGASAFENCSGLKEIGLQNELQYISNSAFKGAGSGTSGAKFYTIEDGVKDLSFLPENVTYIDDYAFQDCYLKKMDLTNCTKLKTINKSAFTGANFRVGDDFKIEDATAEDLREIYKQFTIILPSTLESIGEEAFHDSGIGYLDIPESCTQVGERVFSESKIFGVKLPKTLTSIKEETFYRCYNLFGDAIEIPTDSNLQSIEKHAFAECWDITNTDFLKELKKLTSIGEGAFASCYAYYKLNNSTQSDSWSAKSIACGLENVTLPDCVTELGKGAFADNYNLQTVSLGDGIINIPDNCFGNSQANKNNGSRLEQVIVSEKLQNIGDQAFANQFKLSTIGYKSSGKTILEEGTIQFADGLVSIGNSAFLNCGSFYDNQGMSAVRILVKKENIKNEYSTGYFEFIAQKIGNKNSEHIFVAPANIVDANSVAEEEYENYEEYYVVAQMKYYDPNTEVTSTTSGAKNYTAYPTFYNTTQNEYQDRFYGQSSISKTIYLDRESTISLIPDTGLTGVFMPPKMEDLGISDNSDNKNTASAKLSYVFGVQKLIIPDSLKDDNIGEAAFMNCCNLETVRLPKALTAIKKDTFNGCGGLIVNFINQSEDYKLNDYYGLHTINMPNTLTTIGNSAFKGCSNLVLENPQGVGSSFGTSVQIIEDSAFMDCVSLDEVVFPSSLISIGKSAFSRTTLLEQKEREVPYENSDKTAKYKVNRKEYGTNIIKRGLRTVDFERAGKLEKIGENAFEQSNIEIFDLSKTNVKAIETGLLKQCSYLKTVTFSDLTESMASNVMKDDISLTRITAPISSTMQGDTVSGVYGPLGGCVSTNPALVLTQPEGDVQPLPVNKEYELNINAVNEKTLYIYSTPTISILDGGTEHVIYEVKNEEVKKSSYRGLNANVTKDDKGKYHFSITGTEYIDQDSPVTLRVKFATGLQILDSTTYWQSSQQIDYKVSVVDVVTERVTVTASEDNIVKANPNMYVEKQDDKVLYIPSTGQAANNGIVLSANIEPAETTEGYRWESSNPGIVEIVAGTETCADGKTTVKIKRVDTSINGTAVVTVKSGSKSDRITVVCQTSGTGFAPVTTKGDNLPDKLTTSASNPYVLPNGNGGKDQLSVSLNYPEGTEPASQEQLIFISSNPDILSVDEMGNLTTKQASDEVVEITVIAQASGLKQYFYFLVSDDQTVKASSIEISGKEEVNVGEKITLTATVKPKNAGNKEVEWQVKSGSDIVSVDADGNVTGLKKGTAKIIAISKENSNVKSAEFTVKVLAPATSIQILDGSITLEEGKTYSISKTASTSAKNGYVVTPSDTDDTVVWTSSNASVVSVKMSGSRADLTANAPGTAILTATATSGVTASISVTIVAKKINVTGISITKEVTLNVGQTHTLTPTVLPANANEAVTYTYSSNNQKVATVDANGVIRAVGPGTATITAKTNTNRSAYCTVTVKQPAKSIKIYLNKPSVKKVYMAKGQTLSIKAEKNPLTSTDTLTYKSSKKKVAQVSSSGMITAKGKGTAKITVQATSGKKATITVVVSKKQVKAKKVKVKGPSSMKRKQTKKLTVSLVKAKSTDTISFFSSNSSIASVDSYGYVKGIKKGTVKITVQASSGKKAVKKIKIK